MDIVQDLFAVLAAAGLQFPYLGVVLIGTGVVLVCIGAIFLASRIAIRGHRTTSRGRGE
jgi:hypothetical protein